MNFLELCQTVRSESGIAGTNTPTSTVNQVGILAKIVRWVRESWRDIQREYPNWKFLRARANKTLTVGKSEYALLTDFALVDVRKFDPRLCYTFEPDGSGRLPLVEKEYDDFVMENPTIPDGRPTSFCVGPGYVVMFNRKPDKAYLAQFNYWMTTEVLDNDSDVPSIPDDYHETIVWWALVRYGVHEGAVEERKEWKANYARCLRRLEVDQLAIPHAVTFKKLA